MEFFYFFISKGNLGYLFVNRIPFIFGIFKFRNLC